MFNNIYAHTSFGGARLRILLVEDNTIDKRIALSALVNLGYSAHVVKDGIEAIMALQKQQFHVVLMDINLPTLDGWEATRLIREDRSISQPYIVALSAYSEPFDLELEAANVGMNACLTKPFRLSDLSNILEQARQTLA